MSRHWLYRIHDFDEELKKFEQAKAIFTEKDAASKNKLGFGIFKTVNKFRDPIRSTESLSQICYFGLDIDAPLKGLTPKQVRLKKKELLTGVLLGPLTPCKINETQKGLHVYFGITDDLIIKFGKLNAIQNYQSFLARRLIPFYKADPACSDVMRVLRAEGYYHCKNIDAPYAVECVHESSHQYTYDDFLRAYPEVVDYSKYFQEDDDEDKVYTKRGNSLYDRAREIPSREALLKLSGSEYINHEVVTYRENSNGTTQILCNGRGTSCYLKKNKDGFEYLTSSVAKEKQSGFNWISWVEWYHNKNGQLDRPMVTRAVKHVLGDK